MANIALIIFLLFGIAFLGLLGKRFKFPLPIVLVMAGVCLSLIPDFPVISLNPEVVFLIFLPPLLYEAAWKTDWREFKANIRPISLAAIGLVIFTTVLVGMAAHLLIKDISWPLCFLIGAIVSPPDAIAATSITKGLGLHPRIISILEGESLVNDASGLVAYKYALTVVSAGNFVLWHAGLNFLVVALAGIAIGLSIGYLMYLIHKHFVKDSVIEVTLTLLTPFASYLFAEAFHFSGVLAVVTTGLYISFRSGKILSHQGRLLGYSVWEVLVFMLNGFIFVLIGLQLRFVVEGISDDYSTGSLVLYGLGISLVVILVRFIWIVPATLLPRYLSKSIAREEFDPRFLVIFGWAGMRGVVSMAAALAIPFTLANGLPFPHRNLIIYLTFCVILSTLVLLGLTLPWVIRRLKISPYSSMAEEYEVRTKVVTNTIVHIEENLSQIQSELLHNIKSKYEVKFNRLQKTELPSNYFGQGKTLGENIFNEYTQLQLDLIRVERNTITVMHEKGEVSEAVLRKIEYELDLEETRLNMEIYNN